MESNITSQNKKEEPARQNYDVTRTIWDARQPPLLQHVFHFFLTRIKIYFCCSSVRVVINVKERHPFFATHGFTGHMLSLDLLKSELAPTTEIVQRASFTVLR